MTALWTSREAVEATRRIGGRTPGLWTASGVSIDTRTVKQGDLFVALQGENRDGHGFVAEALGKGASAAMVASMPAGADRTKLLTVEDTQAGLEALGAAARNRTAARIAAITGSVGKTSTKEALRVVLAPQGIVHASEASYNNLWGVPLTLARMPAASRFGVFEIGMNHAGEISPLTRQVKPHVAMVTTVAPVHLEHFSGVDAIAAAKAEIFEGLGENGIAVINADNDQAAILAASATRQRARVWTFGEEGSEARLVSLDLEETSSAVEADILGQRIRFTYGAPGRHFAQNALGLLLVVKALGADVKAAADALRGVRAVKGRGERQTVETESGSFDLIDESYNANPVSMAAALALLGASRPGPHGRRIAVLGDMLELGPNGPAMHAGLLSAIEAARCDLVFASGPSMAHLWSVLPGGIRGAYGESSIDIAPMLAADVRPGDVVMVKGSLGSRMATIVESLKARAAAPVAQ